MTQGSLAKALAQWRLGAAMLLAALAFIWPALVNGGPFFFPDTPTYIRGADAAAVWATGTRSVWSDRLIADAAPPQAQSKTPTATAKSTSLHPARPVLAGRSIYYGLFLLTGMWLFGLIGPVFLQALLASLQLAMLLRYVAGARGRNLIVSFSALSAVLAALTPLPFYASMLMPDIFIGFTVGMLSLLFFYWNDMGNWTRSFAMALALMGACFHASILLLAGCMLGLGLLVRLVFRIGSIASLLAAVGILAAAMLGEAAFNLSITKLLGNPPMRPPFLSARIINDGPGYAYLRQTCPGNGFELCHYLDRMPQDSDTFLWSKTRVDGVFSTVSMDTQRRISAQDKRFYMASAAYDPRGVAAAMAANFGRQLTLFDLKDFNYLFGSSMMLPVPVMDRVRQTQAYAKSMPTGWTVWLTVASSVFGAIVLVWAAMARSVLPDRNNRRIAYLGASLILAVLLNAGIASAMSKPHARYQMRIIWLLPLGAGLIIARRRQSIGQTRDGYTFGCDKT
jgi:hypothetical protein